MRNWRTDIERALEDALNRVEVSLDRLRDTALMMRGEARITVEGSLDSARGLLNRARARIEELRRATDDAWVALRPRAETACAAVFAALAEVERSLSPRPA